MCVSNFDTLYHMTLQYVRHNFFMQMQWNWHVYTRYSKSLIWRQTGLWRYECKAHYTLQYTPTCNGKTLVRYWHQQHGCHLLSSWLATHAGHAIWWEIVKHFHLKDGFWGLFHLTLYVNFRQCNASTLCFSLMIIMHIWLIKNMLYRSSDNTL